MGQCEGKNDPPRTVWKGSTWALAHKRVLEMAAFIIPPLPHNLVGFPAGPYGISYDIFTRATEDVPGAGWGAHRGEILLGLCPLLLK